MNFDKICRTCLSVADPMVPIFGINDDETFMGKSIVDVLNSISKIVISTNDCLPTKICAPCMDELIISHLFRIKCVNSDMILKKALNEKNKPNQNCVIIQNLLNNEFDERIEMANQEDTSSKFPETSNTDLDSISIKAEIDYEPNSNLNEIKDCNFDENETENIKTIDETKYNSDEKFEMSDVSDSESESRTLGRAYLPPEHITDDTIPEMFVCIRKCSYECDSADEFIKHIRKFHIKGLTCMICKKAFSTKKSLIMHTKTHVLQWSLCSICGQKLLSKSMKTHLNGHKRDKWIKCDQCENRFLKYSELRVHSILHHAVQHTYKCDRCNIKFPTMELRDQHQDTHNNKSRNHNCDLCSKAFTSSTKLRMHRRVHTGERPYKCEYCDKTFKQKCVMKTHEQSHTKERPFKCPVCTETFRSVTVLMRHVNRHNKDQGDLMKTD